MFSCSEVNKINLIDIVCEDLIQNQGANISNNSIKYM